MRSFGGGPHLLGGEIESVDGRARFAGKVLDRCAGQSGPGRKAERLSDNRRIIPETTFQVGVDGQGRRLHELRCILEGIVARQLTIETAQRRSVPTAGCGKRMEPHRGEQPCQDNAPGIGEQQRRRAVMKREERSSVSWRCHAINLYMRHGLRVWVGQSAVGCSVRRFAQVWQVSRKCFADFLDPQDRGSDQKG